MNKTNSMAGAGVLTSEVSWNQILKVAALKALSQIKSVFTVWNILLAAVAISGICALFGYAINDYALYKWAASISGIILCYTLYRFYKTYKLDDNE